MIRVDGQLVIKSISGRYGSFNVARLLTSIGEFAVKDSMLEQYTEGKYEGSFVIAHIGPSSYSTSSGRTVIEVRAKLDSMTLNEMDTLSVADSERLEPKEPDPLDEERGSPPASSVTSSSKSLADAPASASPTSHPAADEMPFGMSASELASTPQPGQSERSADDADADLFGTIWPLAEIVKLDTTVDRQRLREQSRRLDQLGYTLDYKAQLWRRHN
ncbi:DUF3275 family protein [Pseudomonas sp. GOM7]|uniref:DUF3275 family protein n=1 Tax=Pseudomonas sp. GOM7 TaxID=2998079 RepID=UPI00227CCD15|nr:DUF3275 family protein [Pseudomonas sp. GOM7]WAJ37285.1 DUF3275 family protein [Pseudomonas sp. GOM7]